MIRLILTLALTLVSAAVALGEGVAVAPVFVPGRELAYDVSFTLERSLAMGGGRDRLVQQAGLVLTTESVDDEGVATFGGRFEWIVLDLDRASFRVRVDSRNIEGDSPNKAETTVREMVAKYLESTFSVRVDREGNVLEFSGLDPVTEYSEGKDGSLITLVSGRFIPATMGRDLEPIWRADGAAGKTLAAGESWDAVRTSPLVGPVSVKLETPYLVSEAGDGSVVASGEMAVSIEMPEELEIPIVFTLQDVNGEAEIAWDAEVGALRSRRATTGYTMILEVQVEDKTERQGSQRSAESSLTLVSVTDPESR